MFWYDITICIKTAYALIKVLRSVYSDDKPVMSFISKTAYRAKEKIQVNFGSVKKKVFILLIVYFICYPLLI